MLRKSVNLTNTVIIIKDKADVPKRTSAFAYPLSIKSFSDSKIKSALAYPSVFYHSVISELCHVGWQ